MRIQKHIALLLAFFLLVSNSGVAFNVHFCGDNIAAISSVFSKGEVCVETIQEEKSCCAKVETDHKKCCSDREVSLDDDSEKIVSKSISFDLHSFFVIDSWKPLLCNKLAVLNSTQNLHYYCDSNAPPLFKLYSQFIFYDSI
jgi:hypothetical protein